MTVPILALRRSSPLSRAVFAFIFLTCGLLVSTGRAQTGTPAGATNNVLVTIQGAVEVARGDGGAWTPGRVNQLLTLGDQVRTRERSRATIYLANGMTMQMSELSTFEVPPSGGVHFKSGLFHILNRHPKKGWQFILREATAAILGTDFLVRVNEQTSEIIVLDGRVSLNNGTDEIILGQHEQGTVENGGQLRKTPVVEAVNNLIQWFLYYPGILHVDELNLADAEKNGLAASLAAYRLGDLRAADQTYPWATPPQSDDGRAYRASLLLNAGQVEQARVLIEAGSTPAARALQRLIAAVKFQPLTNAPPPASSSEWLAESYYQQSRAKLELALEAARQANNQAPEFGFAWARVAELEFSFGRTDAALAALEKGLALSPRHAQAVALRGFLLAAKNRVPAAQAEFERAIALDNGLGNAWLGRGLCLFRRGRGAEGLRALHVAAALEPQRSVLRSYLGKAFAQQGDEDHARRELGLARDLDVNDPTSWLYSALLNQEASRINEAVGDLERSRELNDNRGLYRSRQLLDQDRAVRSANLAAIYRDAGMFDVGLREASRAVVSDYANYSSHLFLANSYTELTDPNLVTLRYETAAFSEYLLANLLAPVGASTLSRNISQQEYAKLFERDRLGFHSGTFYSSNGDWQQEATQYGTFGNTAYAVDGLYRSFKGSRPNNDLEQTVLSAQFKQQLTAQDSIYFQVIDNQSESGDLAQYYNHDGSAALSRRRGIGRPNRRLQVTEGQEPNAFLGYHHEWSPGVHTLFLAARLEGELTSNTPSNRLATLFRNPDGQIFFIPTDAFAYQYRGELEIYSAELQQLWQAEKHVFIAGARLQAGDFDGRVRLDHLGGPRSLAFNPNGAARQALNGDFERVTTYAYHHWRVLEPLLLTAGVAYDHLAYPENAFGTPISGRELNESQFSPKAGFIWMPNTATSVRGAYTRSLGGFSYDQSVRLEPTEVAGFNQAFRSLFPEAVAGSVPGSEFETVHLGLDHQFPTRTYAVLEASILRARGEPRLGVFDLTEPAYAHPGQTRQVLRYEERAVTASLHQLLGEAWALGARYRLSQAELESHFPDISNAVLPKGVLPDTERRALLHQLNLFAIYNHPSGFFSKVESIWWAQRNGADDSALSDEDLWQFNLFAGYRFPRRRAELSVGLLNLAGQDYRLNPLNLHGDLARERTLVVNCKFNF